MGEKGEVVCDCKQTPLHPWRLKMFNRVSFIYRAANRAALKYVDYTLFPLRNTLRMQISGLFSHMLVRDNSLFIRRSLLRPIPYPFLSLIGRLSQTAD